MRARRCKWLGAMAVGLSAMLAAPASAQLSTTANGPYYATPSWAQKLTTNRFVILANWNNQAVLDRETGLVWERSPDTEQRNWQQATFHCVRRTTGGRMGWRLPGVQELASLLDPSIDNSTPGPKLPPGHPFLDVPSGAYWSGTTGYFNDNSAAWLVNFNGPTLFYGGKTISLYVWCVRGGQAPDVQ